MNARKLVTKKPGLSQISPKWFLTSFVHVLVLFAALAAMLPGMALAACHGNTDATLSALSLSNGTLSPSFASATVSYTASVANSVASITVTPTTNQGSAAVTVNGIAVTSGSPSSAISLNVGTNIITTVVTAQNCAYTKTYTVNVTRISALATPTVTTTAATGITAAAATLNGTVSSNGANVTAISFDYGLNTTYGNSIAATPSTLTDPAFSTPVSAELIGLNCNTVIHYRAVATNSQGTGYGSDQTLTTAGCSAPFPSTACAATRFNNDLGCSANDVTLSSIAKAPGSISYCVSGTPVTLDLDVTVNFGSASRWDVGIFIANDGNLPTKLPINGGASSCAVDILPITAPATGATFLDLDGAPQGTTDICGDGTAGLSGVKRMTSVTLPCKADPNSAGKIFVPYVLSWDNQKSPIGNLCSSNQYPVPNTSSKCNSPSSSVAVDILVLPTITKTDGITTINPGTSTTYTVEIFNNSGGTLLDSVFKDPAVSGLTVNSVTCSATTGATCPATTVAAMQGTGITIPSANLPNDTKLTFTINATLSAAATVGTDLVNTATVSIGGYSATATDTDLIQISPAATMSFVSSSITENATSVLTITFTNPTNVPVTGVGFTDSYPLDLVNASSANGASTCGGTVTAANGGSSLGFSGGVIPALGTCTVTVNVTSAIAGVYTNSTGAITASSSISAVSAVLTVTVPVYGGYNACDVAANPVTDTTNILCTYGTPTAYIKTKVAGTPFQLDIVALKSGTTPQRDTNYGKQATVELLDASDNSGALNAYNCRSSWTVITSLITGNFTSGRVTTGQFTVAEAYPNVRVHAKYYTGSAREGCSSDNFAIRPSNFTVTGQDSNWETAGTLRALNNTDTANPGSATGAPYSIHKAGKPFTFTATANNAAAIPAVTTKYSDSPTINCFTSAAANESCDNKDPNLTKFVPGATGFVSGVLSSSAATYSDVGVIYLTLLDTSFAAVDTSDGTLKDCSASGAYVCSAATAIGRFVPDHFDTEVTQPEGANVPMACPTGLTCPNVYNGIVYSGQPFTAIVTAKNGFSAPTTTFRFDTSSGFSKAVTLTAWDALGSTTTQNPPAATSGTLSGNSIPAASFASGEATISTPFYVLPNAYPNATPTSPTDIYLRADDNSDNVSSLRSLDPTTTSVEGGVKVVNGRGMVPNAYGSELLPLPINNVEVQYYNGTSWVNSSTDTTSLTVGNVNFSNCLGNLGNPAPACKAAPIVGVNSITQFEMVSDKRVGSITLNAPGAGNDGSVDVTLNGGGWPAWLPSTTGRATFGIYKGNSKFIYIREVVE